MCDSDQHKGLDQSFHIWCICNLQICHKKMYKNNFKQHGMEEMGIQKLSICMVDIYDLCFIFPQLQTWMGSMTSGCMAYDSSILQHLGLFRFELIFANQLTITIIKDWYWVIQAVSLAYYFWQESQRNYNVLSKELKCHR